jgi:hypothetical protein
MVLSEAASSRRYLSITLVWYHIGRRLIYNSVYYPSSCLNKWGVADHIIIFTHHGDLIYDNALLAEVAGHRPSFLWWYW